MCWEHSRCLVNNGEKKWRHPCGEDIRPGRGPGGPSAWAGVDQWAPELHRSGPRSCFPGLRKPGSGGVVEALVLCEQGSDLMEEVALGAQLTAVYRRTQEGCGGQRQGARQRWGGRERAREGAGWEPRGNSRMGVEGGVASTPAWGLKSKRLLFPFNF